MVSTKKYLKENKICFRVCFVLWTIAFVSGIYFALTMEKESFSVAHDFAGNALSCDISFSQWLISSAINNIKFSALYYLCSLFVITLPFSLMLISFKGYSSGFAAAFIIRMYGIKGCALSFTAFVIPHFFSLPIWFVLFTHGLKFRIDSFRNQKITTREQRKKNIQRFTAAMALLTLLLCICSVVEALIVPWLTGLLI